ncbi:lysine exporter LysO family protein [Desulfovibrio mangrovi]|uniref:LysO family transporter n=1 Tax=Desulfovibrio mangrovi TaxID=2976983 RepID=UPI00224766C4|nr:LysO family transporter [Desulfovibrio mangrovi]UZP67795.1 lysine exporter LysO family protein [Desulfovibrio mangrovi]
MFIEVGCILAGIPAGYLLRNRQKAVHAVDKLTMWAIYGLLFLLGVSLGSNDDLVSQLGTIGVRALVISLCCLIGSAAATWALERYILRGRLDER